MENVLVCVLASTRASELTFTGFKRHVLDELNADLALALAVGDDYDVFDPFWRQAKFRWTAPDFRDLGDSFDMAQQQLCEERNLAPADWRSALAIKGIWQGGIACPDPQPSRSAILPFCRWLLLQGLRRDGVLDRYDRFIITRSDFVWTCPHPPLSVLDRDALWFPNGEFYGGLPDRHLVVSRSDVVSCLDLIEDVVLNPAGLVADMKHRLDWNNEGFLENHLRRRNIRHKARLFPYVMYTARAEGDGSETWSSGRYDPEAGHYIKYEGEYSSAKRFAALFRKRAEWEGIGWYAYCGVMRILALFGKQQFLSRPKAVRLFTSLLAFGPR